jgi:hypothetical protein
LPDDCRVSSLAGSLDMNPVGENERQGAGTNDVPQREAVQETSNTNLLDNFLVELCLNEEKCHRESWKSGSSSGEWHQANRLTRVLQRYFQAN